MTNQIIAKEMFEFLSGLEEGLVWENDNQIAVCLEDLWNLAYHLEDSSDE